MHSLYFDFILTLLVVKFAVCGICSLTLVVW